MLEAAGVLPLGEETNGLDTELEEGIHDVIVSAGGTKHCSSFSIVWR